MRERSVEALYALAHDHVDFVGCDEYLDLYGGCDPVS